MNTSNHIIIPGRDFVNIQAKLIFLLQKYGYKAVDKYLEAFPLKLHKMQGRYLGAYIENKVLEEFKLTRYELFESKERQNNLFDARLVICTLLEKHLKLHHHEISAHFNKSRHLAKRLTNIFKKKLAENHVFDSKLIAKYNKLDALIGAYVDFKPTPHKET